MLYNFIWFLSPIIFSFEETGFWLLTLCYGKPDQDELLDCKRWLPCMGSKRPIWSFITLQLQPQVFLLIFTFLHFFHAPLVNFLWRVWMWLLFEKLICKVDQTVVIVWSKKSETKRKYTKANKAKWQMGDIIFLRKMNRVSTLMFVWGFKLWECLAELQVICSCLYLCCAS